LIESIRWTIGLIGNAFSLLMTATALPENYCVCVGEDGAPRELGRSGTAITYKAMGYQSGQAVALQLIPLANVSESGRAQFELKARAVRKLKHPNVARVFDVREEDQHLVFATEFLQGETAERWVVTHGPMPPAAVLRIGLQVVSALAEAAFHSLSHRAIQPSNLMIVSGADPDGDWPFVKLLNFGLAGLRLYSEGSDELAPPIGAAFASPEQLEKGKVDFRSEIFSLGATMCFLLTGAVPLAGSARKSGAERTLPSDASVPRAVRRLLRHMLRIDPDQRPRDPLFLTDELRRCLHKVERRRVGNRPVGLPLQAEPKMARENRSGWTGPFLIAATLLLLLGALGAVWWRGHLPWLTQRDRPLESIGVPIGINENAPANRSATPASPAPTTERSTLPAPVVQDETHASEAEQAEIASADSPAPEASAAPEQSIAPVVAENFSPSAATTPAESAAPTPPQSAEVQNSPAAAADETKVPLPADSPMETPAEDTLVSQPSPPAEAASDATAPPPENVPAEPVIAEQEAPESKQQEPAENSNQNAPSAVAPAAGPAVAGPETIATRKPSSVPARRGARRSAPARAVPPMRVGGQQARLVGTTGEGKWILSLPSGETVITPPLPNTNDAPMISQRKVRRVRIPSRTLPSDNRAPVVVLPPQN
jgi:Protein kinase domain